MRKIFAIAVVVVGAVSLLAGQAHAVVMQFQADLLGASEVPPNASPGTGFASFDFETTTNLLTLTDSAFSGLVAPSTLAHVHEGPPGVIGGVIINMTLIPPGGTSGTLGMTATVLTAGQVTSLLAGNLYVNVHSETFPVGEIRGHLALIPGPGALALVGLAAIVGGRRRRG